MLKFCQACKESRSAELFHKDASRPDGLQRKCKACRVGEKPKLSEDELARMRLYRVNNLAAIKAYKARPEVMEANRAVKAAAYRRDPAKALAYQSAQYAKHADVRRASARVYCQENRASIAAHNADRRGRKRRQTPACVDQELFDLVLREAAELAVMRRSVFGFAWHIDHIVPLKSPVVCGFHAPGNLQVVPATYNFRKKCSFSDANIVDRGWL